MRTILLLIGMIQIGNGLAMLALPGDWYQLAPGVTETGPANLHFIRDIGLAFLAAGVGLVIAARHETSIAALVPSAVFLGGHALLHVAEFAEHGATTPEMARDTLLIVLPGLLPAFALWQRLSPKNQRSVS